MKSDRPSTQSVPPYLGVDLSSRYGAKPRAIDVCGLTPSPAGGFDATFWHWSWDAPDQELDLRAIADELRRARSVMVDGPHALAAKGRRIRSCERLCRTAGKTPDRVPAADVPYGTFIRSAVEWFAALHGQGIPVSPPGGINGVSEFYPAETWVRLSQRRLPTKTSAVGRKVRTDLLRRMGVRLPLRFEPTHDALDACVGAVLAAAADGRVPGVGAQAHGLALQIQGNTLREGPIWLPTLLI